VSAADGERIAPVTYLFGTSTKETEAPQPSAAPGPSFVDLDALQEEIRQIETRADSVPEPAAKRGKASFDRISNVSMHALARRGMSSRELRDYLIGREFEPAEVDEEIARLERVALLDDAALAQILVDRLRERKGLGRSAITSELRRRHFDAAAIEAAMGEIDDDELARASELAIRRAPQLRSLDDQTATRRLGAFLMRKGYSGSVVSTAVQRALHPSGPTFR
jgi:regulatory protein